MSEDSGKPKSNIHIHIGGIILILVIFIVLFKVDLKKAINSPKFQTNIAYVEEQIKTFWDKYISNQATLLWNNMVNTAIDKAADELKNKVIDNPAPINPINEDKFDLGGMQGEETAGGMELKDLTQENQFIPSY